MLTHDGRSRPCDVWAVTVLMKSTMIWESNWYGFGRKARVRAAGRERATAIESSCAGRCVDWCGFCSDRAGGCLAQVSATRQGKAPKCGGGFHAKGRGEQAANTKS